MSEEKSYWQSLWKQRVSRRRMLQGAALGGMGLAAAAVIGCSDEESSPSSSAGPSGSGAASETPRSGGTHIYVSQSSEAAPTLDIHKIGHTTMFRTGASYSKLIRHDMTKYPNVIDFAPELAESYQVVDPTTYIFKLRQGVKFHNIAPVNGREIKASDVVYSHQRMISEGVNASVLSNTVANMEATDDYTVKYTLKQPNADFLWAIQDPRSEIIAHESVESAGGDLKDGPIIGTGPWIFEQWVPEQVTKLKKNPDYFLKPFPYGDEWQMLTIPDLQTGQAAFRTGQVLNNQANDQITRLLKQGVPDLQIVEGKLLGAASGDRLWMSPQNTATKDVRVRQALGKLFDRQALVRDVLFGAGWITTGIFLPAVDWHMSEADILKQVGLDVQGAKQLFQAAGFDPGSWKPTLDSGIPTPTSTDPTTEVYVSGLKQVGIDATVHKVDKVEITDKIWLNANTDFCICNKPTFSGVNGELYFFYHSSGRFAAPYKQLGDTQFDALIDKQAQTLNAEERKGILMDVQKRILETAIVMPIYSRTNAEAIQPKLRGYQNDPNEPHRYAEAWLSA